MRDPLEVSWTAAKVTELPPRRGIDPFKAVPILEDPKVRLVAMDEAPYIGQERAVGMDALGRLITVAMTIHYPDHEAGADLTHAVGVIRCHTAWLSTGSEAEIYNGAQ